MMMSFPSFSSSFDDGGGGGGGHGGGCGGRGNCGGGSGLICQRRLGHCGHVKEGKVESTKEDFVLSGPKREPEIYGKDYFADDKLQDQIITTFLALNHGLVSEHALLCCNLVLIMSFLSLDAQFCFLFVCYSSVANYEGRDVHVSCVA